MIWFSEPNNSDDTWADWGESTGSWLARSTLPRAVACREFMNRNLSALPDEAQKSLAAHLQNRRDKWNDFFFELVVGRTLQILGANISYELLTSNRSRIDFCAQFEDGLVHVEATSLVTAGSMGSEMDRDKPLFKILEQLIPNGAGVMIGRLPELGLNDSKKEFKAMVQAWIETFPAVGKGKDLAEQLPQGAVELVHVPNPPGGEKIVIYPAYAAWDNTEGRIRVAVAKKKKQVRGAGGPAILAIQGSSIMSDKEDFDQALLGRFVSKVDRWRGEYETYFDPNGLFTTVRSEAPTIDGVLAFLKVGFPQIDTPILYLHPRSKARLPAALLDLECRSYDYGSRSIVTVPSSGIEIGDHFGLVKI